MRHPTHQSHAIIRRIPAAVVALLFCLSSLTASPQSAPNLAIHLASGKAALTVSAEAGSPCTVQFATNLPATEWFPLTNATLATGSVQVTDPQTPAGERFYRALIPVPTNMVWVPAGSFVMGSPTNEIQRSTNELQHPVSFTNGFFVARFLVTQSNWISMMGTNPSYFVPSNGFTADLNRPVEEVNWFDASNYCFALTRQQQGGGQIFTNWFYRLPTESEWEYACRAGTTNAFYLGDNLLSGQANFNGMYEYLDGVGDTNDASGVELGRTSDVGAYAPNAFGLYDMAGNVWEWCQDWFTNYPVGAVTDPQGPTNGLERVFRGGTLNAVGHLCRSAQRDLASPTTAVNTIGFRVVLSSVP
jgi:sulfatase modifying factor 1